MVTLTGKNSIAEILSLSENDLTFFDKIAKEFGLYYNILIKAFNDKEIKSIISFYNRNYECVYALSQEDFYRYIGYYETVDKVIRDESNKNELNETLDYLRYKMSIISDFLKFEKNLKINELKVYFNSDVYFDNDSSKDVVFCLKSDANSSYNMHIGKVFNNDGCSFRYCNSKDIEYIMNNYKIKQNTEIFLTNNRTRENRDFSVNKNINEVKDKILKFINNKDKGINNDSINR